MAQRSNDGAKRGGLFDDLSFAQVIAGALAAVTSMLLASQIGIYGSAIGVGVGSVVSAVASQLYKKFLQRSADKLRELNPSETIGLKAADAGDAPVQSGAHATAMPPSVQVDDGLRSGDSEIRRARAQREHKRKLKRNVLIVSIASALAAVAISAFLINAVSAGQGVGAKTEPILPSRSQPSGEAASGGTGAADDAGGQAGSSSTQKNDASQSPSNDEGNAGSADGKAGAKSSSSTDANPDGTPDAAPDSNEGSTSGDQGEPSADGSSGGSSDTGEGQSSGGDGSSGSGSDSEVGAGSSGGSGQGSEAAADKAAAGSQEP